MAGGLEGDGERRGSEWRRWDLQVHTPRSVLNNGFGDDFEAYARALFEAAVAADIHAIGITDYFTIDGYRELRRLVADGPRLRALLGDELAVKAGRILLLPNVELRTTPLISVENGRASRVNLHVIFSEVVPAESIADDFLHSLQFTSEAGPGQPDELTALTPANLQALGRRLKQQQPEFRTRSDLYVGMMNAVVSHEEVTRVLTSQSRRFQDKYILVVPSDEDLSELHWDDQGHHARKLLVQKSHMIFSANRGTRDFGLGRRHPTPDAFIADFRSLKPCIHGSDAHDYESLFRPAGGRQLWIKGDITFQGLRQLISEPEARVFIGDLPPALDRVRKHPTKIVRSVEIRRRPGSTLAERWFDARIELNPELVAIIGKKGSGKSALADVLGLLGNTPRHDAFSFLSASNFRHSQRGKAQHFEASLEWEDGSLEGPRTLDRDPDANAVEKIKYLPQSYLEAICTEVGAGTGSRFYAELEQAIFSHVPEADRLGSGSLHELLGSLGREIERSIELSRDQLRTANAEIVALEDRLDPAHRGGIGRQLEERRRELAAHEEAAPPVMPPPDEDAAAIDQTARAAAELAGVRAELDEVQAKIAQLEDEDAAAARRGALASGLIDRVKNMQRLVLGELASAAPDFREIGIEAADVLTVRMDLAPLEAVAEGSRRRRLEIRDLLDPETESSPAESQELLVQRAEAIAGQLSEPERRYEAHLAALSDWESARAAIVGRPDLPGSIAYLEAQLEALDTVPSAADAGRRRRGGICAAIFADKERLRARYAEFYRPVEEFLGGHPVAETEGFRLTFRASVAEEGFADRLLALVHHGRVGAFQGVEEGRARLSRLLGDADFSSADGALAFADGIVALLDRGGGGSSTLRGQLRQGATPQDVYDLVYGLDYLKPIYELRWDGRRVDELSPGERGDLLLIFYLLIDQSDIPIVLDQPEENLDNQTIVGTLVPCMRDAKRRRQVIMVTHNPNLAVVCDADQVIVSEIDRSAGNLVTYRAGSIEDPDTNQRVVDVLEGTRPAFDKREARYGAPVLPAQ